MELEEILKDIEPENADARAAARRHWNSCAKPLGGLGLLETALEDIAALTGSADVDIRERAVLVLCADNGVVCQGISQSPMGGADFPGARGVLARRSGNGTADITVGPAMTRAQAEQAVLTGIELVREQAERGVRLLATGEMGIGNTTTSSTVASVLLDRPVEEMTGRGAGLSNEGLIRKAAVIRQALACNQPDRSDILDVLSKVGGFDIAGLCGIFLGGALYRVPVLIDGRISAVAALCALRLCPAAGKAILASHVSAEPAGRLVLEALGKQPLITAGMHLGEGTGAVAAIPLLDMACAVYHGCYTFDDGGIEAYQPLGDGQ